LLRQGLFAVVSDLWTRKFRRRQRLLFWAKSATRFFPKIANYFFRDSFFRAEKKSAGNFSVKSFCLVNPSSSSSDLWQVGQNTQRFRLVLHNFTAFPVKASSPPDFSSEENQSNVFLVEIFTDINVVLAMKLKKSFCFNLLAGWARSDGLFTISCLKKMRVKFCWRWDMRL